MKTILKNKGSKKKKHSKKNIRKNKCSRKNVRKNNKHYSKKNVMRGGDHEFDMYIVKLTNNDRTLTSLNINYNNIGAIGAEALANALKGNTTLETLDISFNEITEDGVRALAKALETNTTLTNLNIAGNNIGNIGATALANALEGNTTLTTLDISDNNIGDERVKVLEDKIKRNLKVLEDKIEGNLFSPNLKSYEENNNNKDKTILDENINFIKKHIKIKNLPNDNNNTKQKAFDLFISNLTISNSYFKTLIKHNYDNGMNSIKTIKESQIVHIILHGSIINNIFKLPDNINIVFLSPIDYLLCHRDNLIEKLNLNFKKYIENPFCFNNPEIINIFKEAIIYYGGQYCIDLNLAQGNAQNNVTGMQYMGSKLSFNKPSKYTTDKYRSSLSLILKEDFNKEGIYTIFVTACRGANDNKKLLKIYEQTIKILNFKIYYDSENKRENNINNNKSKKINNEYNKCQDFIISSSLQNININYIQFVNNEKHNSEPYVTSRHPSNMHKNIQINTKTNLETLIHKIKLITEKNKYVIFTKIFNKLPIVLLIYNNQYFISIKNKNIINAIIFLFKTNYKLMFEYLVYCQIQAKIIHKKSEKKELDNYYFLEYCIDHIKELQLLTDIDISNISFDYKNNSILFNFIIDRYINTITTLNCSKINLNDDGAQDLATAIETNNTLTILYMSNNKISNIGAIALLKALKINKKLILIDISKNYISNSNEKAIKKAVQDNAILDISKKKGFSLKNALTSLFKPGHSGSYPL